LAKNVIFYNVSHKFDVNQGKKQELVSIKKPELQEGGNRVFDI
jgi:hypothetical protein